MEPAGLKKPGSLLNVFVAFLGFLFVLKLPFGLIIKFLVPPLGLSSLLP
jgi:hypothetical protein